MEAAGPGVSPPGLAGRSSPPSHRQAVVPVPQTHGQLRGCALRPGRREACPAPSVQRACRRWPVAVTSLLLSVLPVVSSDSDSDSDLSSSSLEDRLPPPGPRDLRGGRSRGESGECGERVLVSEAPGAGGFAASVGLCSPAGVRRVALGQEVLRSGPGAGRLGARVLAPLKSTAERGLSCIFRGRGVAALTSACTPGPPPQLPVSIPMR